MSLPKCERCGAEEFFNMPDSLAYVCKECGFVWVCLGPGKFERGADIQTWLQDTYGAKVTK